MSDPVQNLVTAARELIEKGGSITRRNALREALNALPFGGDQKIDFAKQWNFTPHVKWVLCRAANLASNENDDNIRTSHIEQALREVPEAWKRGLI